MVNSSDTDKFLSKLVSYELPNAFNPWGQNCSVSDGIESKNIRCSNLKAVLEHCLVADCVDLWIGRDLGWRGGRRTGVPFVDETTLMSYAQSLDKISLKKATIDKTIRERTACEIEIARKRVGQKLFFWNVFPFHPHENNRAFTNRQHTPSERKLGEMLLLDLISIIKVRKIVTVGSDASVMVRKLGIDCNSVRHPSFGGQKQFHREIDDCYELESNYLRQHNLFDSGMYSGR